jgi:putative ABC transport system permease protein
VFLDPRENLARQRTPRPPQADRMFLTIGGSSIAFAVRTTDDPAAILRDLRGIARDIDPRLAVDAAVPMERIVSSLTTRPRFYAVLLSTFGAIAAFIAVIGLYGVLSYVVGQRTKELGIRMALGAQRGGVLALVVREGLVLVGAGLAIGLFGALALTRALGAVIFGRQSPAGLTLLVNTAPTDVLTYAAVALTLVAVAVLACLIPARRAASVDPIVALRAQ